MSQTASILKIRVFWNVQKRSYPSILVLRMSQNVSVLKILVLSNVPERFSLLCHCILEFKKKKKKFLFSIFLYCHMFLNVSVLSIPLLSYVPKRFCSQYLCSVKYPKTFLFSVFFSRHIFNDIFIVNKIWTKFILCLIFKKKIAIQHFSHYNLDIVCFSNVL